MDPVVKFHHDLHPSTSTPRRTKLQRSERVLVLESADPEVRLSIAPALLGSVVGFIPLVTAQLTQHPHDAVVVLVALAVPLAAGVRRCRIVHGVAEFGPLALLTRGLGVRERAAGEVGCVQPCRAAVAGAGFGLDGDGGALLETWEESGGPGGVHFCRAVAVGEVGRGWGRCVEGAGGVEEALEVCCDGAFGGGVVDVVEEAVEGCFGGVEVCWEGGVGGVVGQGGHWGDSGVGGGVGAVGGEPGAALAFVVAARVVLLDVAGGLAVGHELGEAAAIHRVPLGRRGVVGGDGSAWLGTSHAQATTGILGSRLLSLQVDWDWRHGWDVIVVRIVSSASEEAES